MVALRASRRSRGQTTVTWHGEGGAAGLDISEGGGGGSGSAVDTSSLSFLVIIGSSEVQAICRESGCYEWVVGRGGGARMSVCTSGCVWDRQTTDGRSANRWVHFQSGVGGEGGCGGGGGGGGGGGVGLNSSDRRQTSNQMGGKCCSSMYVRTSCGPVVLLQEWGKQSERAQRPLTARPTSSKVTIRWGDGEAGGHENQAKQGQTRRRRGRRQAAVGYHFVFLSLARGSIRRC
ncbi:hypothetical protein IWZ03DRAFT_186674 [Phyllosticta citriasiana]|uniref:Uncharacterized protein n=1 Tax=Phyllosticta citriasiana TaxID=595635 RepID=A0ABR1KLL5_9PEZI